MTVTYYGYPKCGTCRKAKKWLENEGISFEEYNIAEQPPGEETLRKMVADSGLEMKKFFNTSGMKYRELQLKDKLPSMSDEEKIALLASDGMLIKRPIVTDGDHVTVGFNEDTFAETWSK